MNESKRTRSAHTTTGAGHNGENTSAATQAITASPEATHKHRLALAVTAAAAAVVLAVGGLASAPASASENSTVAADSTAGTAIPFTGQPSGNGDTQSPNTGQGSNGIQGGNGSQGSNGSQGGFGTMPGSGQDGSGQNGYGSQGGDAQGSQGSQQDATPASAQESKGIVLIDTQLGYENAEAAGTGIVLSKDGLILTNNHVIADSTKIAVTVATTGKTYEASVVGSDSTEDVAVLKLKDASNLTPATLDQDAVNVGDDITAVGNSEGGGQLQAADGTVTDLGASVTTTAQGTEDSETLDNMIQVQADIVSGDSGGALLDDEGEVAGMNTAASSGSAVVTGYAIPIETALTTAESIIDGQQTSTNTLGYPAFLGIGVEQSDQQSQSGQSSQNGQSGQGSQYGQGNQYGEGTANGQYGQSGSAAVEGAVVAGVYEDTPAAEAGLSAGDTITKIGSTQITDATGLSKAIADHKPGDKVSVTWTDANGQSHSAEVTLTEGPAA